LAGVFRARVVDVAPTAIVIEITGTEDKIDGLLDVLRHYGILEMVRTGRVAMSRGANGNGATLAASAAAAAADSGAPLLDTDDGMIAFSV
jgi:acetolactate synthase-1/3 small subunit